MSTQPKAPRPAADATSPGLPAIAAGPDAHSPEPGSEPRVDRVTRRAYQIYEERGGSHGFDESDWLQAEREIREAELEQERDRSQSGS